VNCTSGETLASTEAEASDKSHVLDALGKTASEIRSKLGESLASVQKFATPIEEATTSSLEALKAYSTGRKAWHEKGDAAGVPYYEQAIELDPNFAMAYSALSVSYTNLGQATRASENSKKAFELRERASVKSTASARATTRMSPATWTRPLRFMSCGDRATRVMAFRSSIWQTST
jgi:hypothetical protein